MSFFETETKNKYYKKPVYLKLSQGENVIRVLEPVARRFFQHWMDGPIECLGDECPQCALNRKILAEVNHDFKRARNIDGFLWGMERGAVNVLDRTKVKICPNCGEENRHDRGQFKTVCDSCGAVIAKVEAKPSNVVKILVRAATLFKDIAQFEGTKLDADGNPLSISDFDIRILVAGNSAIPDKSDNVDDVSELVGEQELYDLQLASLKLTPDEMLKKMRGVSLRDIFVARKAVGDAVAEEATEAIAEKKTSVRDLDTLRKEIEDELFS